MILRARAVLPIIGRPICNGAVWIRGSRLAAVGPWRDMPRLRQRVLDLGEVLLMPGLVNAHCHLDYTHMAGHFPPPKVFTDWLKSITETKAGWNITEYANSWQEGAAMLLRTGTTTVGDIEAVPELLPRMWDATPLRVISFLEMIGITARRAPTAVLDETLTRLAVLSHRRCRIGLSPHAPYSTLPDLLRLSGKAARQRRWVVCTHVAESELEFLMFKRGLGTMFEWLRRSGRDMSDCGLGSPVRHLERCGLLQKNLLAAHANYLDRSDAALLARRGVSVVHCPRSHAYFRHEPFPLRKLLRAGVNICLGTDSLASVVKRRREPIELSMLDEMRALAEAQPDLTARQIVEFATTNGARALNLARHVGHLSRGMQADLIALPMPGQSAEPYETVLQHRGPLAASMIGGRWVLPPGNQTAQKEEGNTSAPFP